MFLDRHRDDEYGIYYDLYYCSQDCDLPIVLARYGDDGREYASGWFSPYPALVEARRRARACNLDPGPWKSYETEEAT